MTPELSRPLPVERVGSAGLRVEVNASTEECRAVAERLQIPAILELRCTIALRPEAGSIRAEGRLEARVVRLCVVSLEEFETPVEEDFVVRFVPAGEESDEIDPEAEDEMPYTNATIDLGEAASVQLALALDPYPRRPGAVLEAERPAPSHPFAALDGLRRRH